MKILNNFITQKCKPVQSSRVSVSTLFNEYKSFGGKMTPNEFYSRMKFHYDVQHQKRIKYFLGVQIKSASTR